MRLIDGAELFLQVCRTHDELIGLDELAELMDKMPAIDAIPVEWIKEFVNERAANDGPDGWWHFWGEDVLMMIAQWEKENG